MVAVRGTLFENVGLASICTTVGGVGYAGYGSLVAVVGAQSCLHLRTAGGDGQSRGNCFDGRCTPSNDFALRSIEKRCHDEPLTESQKQKRTRLTWEVCYSEYFEKLHGQCCEERREYCRENDSSCRCDHPLHRLAVYAPLLRELPRPWPAGSY